MPLNFKDFNVEVEDLKTRPYLKYIIEAVRVRNRIYVELKRPVSQLSDLIADFNKEKEQNEWWAEDVHIVNIVDKIFDRYEVLLKCYLDLSTELENTLSDLYDYLEAQSGEIGKEEEGSLVDVPDEKEGSLVEEKKLISTLNIKKFEG